MNIVRRALVALLVTVAALIGSLAPTVATAADLTNYGENKTLDALFRGQTLSAPASWHLGLYTDTCTDAGPGTEVSTSGTAYARQAVAASLTAWAGTQSAGSTTASTGTTGTTSNNAVISCPESTAAWGTIQSVGFNDASTAGNRWICINLSAPFAVSGAGITVKFNAGTLTFQIDN
ncbi:hypothetical protein CGK74_13630 [Thauera propionica]|uniref:Uncharacterized protein n=1 Tax=Thauera propionica TaxID=2019431 RepID=A0A235EW65_9RHOO|nr:hypothetical protein [Thauera propionica]OYD53250.1 hypothetical protein CGK74_13630 [Thauera propionica]